MKIRHSLFSGLIWQAGVLTLLLAVIIGGGSVLVVNHALEASARADIEFEAALMHWNDSLLMRDEAAVRAAYEHPDLPNRVYIFADENGNRTVGGSAAHWPTNHALYPGWIWFDGNQIGKKGGRYIALVHEFVSENTATTGPLYIGDNPPVLKDYLLVGRRIDATDALIQALWPGITIVFALSLLLTWLYARWRTLVLMDRVGKTIIAIDDFGLNRSNVRLPKTTRSSPDELDALNSRIAAMMARVGELLHGLDRISEQVAHEVKDELEQLKLGLDADKDRKVIDRLSHTQKLVGDILELVRLESGADTLSEPFDLKNSARKAANLYADAYEDAGLTIEFELGDDTPAEIVGRETLIIRAIADLLNNSLRHMSDEGYVRISLSRSKSIYHLEVQDSGGGVADTNIDYLARDSRLKGAPNTSGSGLRFVRAVMMRHGGTISLVNEDSGLRVILCFPQPDQMRPDVPRSGKIP